jgi:acyl dehydratase
MATLWEELHEGALLGEINKGIITPAHIMRWSAAVENWHRIHYDHRFATEHDKLPDVLINGSWKQHVLVQLVQDALGQDSWVWKIKFRYKKMDIAGDSILAQTRVISKTALDGLGFVTLKIVLLNQKGEESTAGFAIGVVELPNGEKVPYPFVPKDSYSSIRLPEEE